MKRIKSKKLAVSVAVALSAGFATAAYARDIIQIAGSSTVLPFASIVAEEFGNVFSQFKTPVVASGGSGGGLRQFCQGVGDNAIDIANASRPIKPAEIENCAKAGVKQIHEVMLGYDGIVFSSASDKPAFSLTPKHLYLAAAAKVPQDGKLVANQYNRWSQIDATLPNQEIVLVVPAGNHGTREVFEEKVLYDACSEFAEIKALDKESMKAVCASLRKDGRVVEISGDYTETLARLDAQGGAVGVFGLSFYEQNRDRLRVASINGVTPSAETVASGEYPVSRPLFFYVKGERIGVVPGIEQYTEFFLSDQVSGAGSPLETAGLIPLDDAARSKVLADFKARKIVVAK